MEQRLLPVLVIVAGFLVNYVFQRGQTSQYDYSCGTCGNVFSLSALAASAAPHRFGGNEVGPVPVLRCPLVSGTSVEELVAGVQEPPHR